jgi:ribose-phosphate pyrophosphokinase
LAIIDKRRERANVCAAMNVIGDVAGKTAILLDDMVDTAGTLCSAADILMQKGAKEVHACCSHGVLSGPAIDRLEASQIKQLVITDSVPLRANAINCAKVKVLSVAGLFGDAIKCIHSEDSVSSLFV